MNLCNNCLIIYEELPDGTVLVYTELDSDGISSTPSLFPNFNALIPVELSDFQMGESEKIRITEIGSSEEELFHDSLDSNSSCSANLPTDGIPDNEAESDKSSKEEMQLALPRAQYLPNKSTDVPISPASTSQGYEEEDFIEEEDDTGCLNDRVGDITPNNCYYKTESESELEELSYSGHSTPNTQGTSGMSGFTPVVKRSRFLLKTKKNTKSKKFIDTKKDKKGTLLSRVQLDDDLSPGHLTSTTPQIDVSESDSPSPRKSRKSQRLKSDSPSPRKSRKSQRFQSASPGPSKFKKPRAAKSALPRKARKHQNSESSSTSPRKISKSRAVESQGVESRSVSPRRLRKPRVVKVSHKESESFAIPIAVERSCELITCASRSSIGSCCIDRPGAETACATDSTESFKRNELAMNSCFTTPRDLAEQFTEESEAEEEEKEEEEEEREEEEEEREEEEEEREEEEEEREEEEEQEQEDEDEDVTKEVADKQSGLVKKLDDGVLTGRRMEFSFANLTIANTEQSEEVVELTLARKEEPIGIKAEIIEECRSLETDQSSSNKRSWADCTSTNCVHPLKKHSKPPKETIKNFIALNKAQLHRGSERKTYTEIFLERKAKAEAKKRVEFARMMGVKIPSNAEEENEPVLCPFGRSLTPDAAGDVELNNGPRYTAKPHIEEKDVEKVPSNEDVNKAKASTSGTSSEVLKRTNYNVGSSKQDTSQMFYIENLETANQKTAPLADVNFQVSMAQSPPVKETSNEKVKGDTKMNESLRKDNFGVHNTLDTDGSSLVVGMHTAASSIPRFYHKANPDVGKAPKASEILLGLKEPLLTNKSSSDTEILKKIAAQQSESAGTTASAQQDDNSITSTLSTGFISATRTDSFKMSVESTVPEGNKLLAKSPDPLVQPEDKEEVQSERINRSKKKKKVNKRKPSAEKEEDPDILATPRTQRSSSLPPLIEGEISQDGKNNNNNYKPYTLKDYRQLQLDIQLGGLGPNSDRNVLQEKLQKYQRQANYAQQVMERNRKLLEAKIEKNKTTFAQVIQEASDPSKDARQRALDYAKNIRKPPSKLEKEENKEPIPNKQVKLPPLKTGADGAAKGGTLETVVEEEPVGFGSPVKTRPFAMDSLMENVEKLRERHAKEREIVEQLFTGRNTQRKDQNEKNEDKQKKKRSKKK